MEMPLTCNFLISNLVELVIGISERVYEQVTYLICIYIYRIEEKLHSYAYFTDTILDRNTTNNNLKHWTVDIKWKLTLSNGGNAIFNLKPYHCFQCQGAPDLSSIFIECRFKIIQQSLATIEIAFTSQIALVMVIEYLRFY